MDSLNSSKVAEDLQKEKDKLVKKVLSLEREIENSSTLADELSKENKQLEDEVDTLKSDIEYQDFVEAIKTIESYKASQSIKEAIEFMAFNHGHGYFTTDREGNALLVLTLMENG